MRTDWVIELKKAFRVHTTVECRDMAGFMSVAVTLRVSGVNSNASKQPITTLFFFQFLLRVDEETMKENSLIIRLIQWARRYRFEVIDFLKPLLKRPAKNRTENRLAHASIRTVDLQNSQLRPQDRSNLSHLAHITPTSPASKLKTKR